MPRGRTPCVCDPASVRQSTLPCLKLMHEPTSLRQAEDFAAAAALAFELRQARRLLAVVDTALERGQAGAAEILGGLVAPLGPEQLRLCLEFCREWNTHSRHCHAAQATLQAVLRHHPPQARAPVRWVIGFMVRVQSLLLPGSGTWETPGSWHVEHKDR